MKEQPYVCKALESFIIVLYYNSNPLELELKKTLDYVIIRELNGVPSIELFTLYILSY